MLRFRPLFAALTVAATLAIGCAADSSITALDSTNPGGGGGDGGGGGGGGGGTSVPEAGTFVQPSVTVNGTVYPFQLFIPKNYNTAQKSPVILYIDGSGGRGTDNQSQVAQALGAIVRARANTYPAVVIFPQVPAAENTPRSLITAICLAELDYVLNKYSAADANRVYVTGISFGGGVAYELAYENPTRFAALAPISSVYNDGAVTSNPGAPAGSSYPLLAQRVKGMAVGIWHGALDTAPPPTIAQGIYSAIVAAGGNARLTVVPNMGHEIWDQIYVDESFYTWLYAQHR